MNWSDFMLYMIATPSEHTESEIKAWKGMLDSEGFVKAGWVHSLKLHEFQFNGSIKYVIMGEIKHSQRVSTTPLLPWAVVDQNGLVQAAHCTCVAGLGEACSHIAALLSCVVKASQARQSAGVDSSTSVACSWLPPSRNVIPAHVCDIKFVSPRKRRYGTSTNNDTDRLPGPSSKTVAPQSPSRVKEFLAQLNKADKKPAILKITQPFAVAFVPKFCKDTLPLPLTELYNPDALAMDYLTLLAACENTFSSIKITTEQAEKLEEETWGQSSNKSWFVHRAGRITASNMKAAVHTNMSMPSPSLIKRICYPEAFKFSTPATRWGCDHEKSAIAAYTAKATKQHQCFTVSQAGMFIDVEQPFVAASPDGIVSCTCCGKGTVEVKCPFCVKKGLPEDEKENSCSCLTWQDGKWTLAKDHAYYYQVQTQMGVCKLAYSDFIVWTEKEMLVERINADASFFEATLDKAKQLFVYGILPEVIGKWYTRKPVEDQHGIVVPHVTTTSSSCSSTTDDQEDYEASWCYCNQPPFGTMIKCDNEKRSIEWFHCDCLRIRHPPKGKWYCPACRKLPQYTKKSKKGNH